MYTFVHDYSPLGQKHKQKHRLEVQISGMIHIHTTHYEELVKKTANFVTIQNMKKKITAKMYSAPIIYVFGAVCLP